MSKATKRKHVLKEAMQNYFEPPTEDQDIVRIISSRGNNLHEVETPLKETYLVSMPTKFRKNIWVKRGDFVIVEPIAEGDKVKAEMVRVLSKEHIKYFKKINVWPSEFEVKIGDTYEDLSNGMNDIRIPSSESEGRNGSGECSDASSSSFSSSCSDEDDVSEKSSSSGANDNKR